MRVQRAYDDGGCTRGSLARGLCEATDWRNANGDLRLTSARRRLVTNHASPFAVPASKQVDTVRRKTVRNQLLQRPDAEQLKLGGRLSLQHLVTFKIPETIPGIMNH